MLTARANDIKSRWSVTKAKHAERRLNLTENVKSTADSRIQTQSKPYVYSFNVFKIPKKDFLSQQKRRCFWAFFRRDTWGSPRGVR